jgi:hypothetical protein
MLAYGGVNAATPHKQALKEMWTKPLTSGLIGGGMLQYQFGSGGFILSPDIPLLGSSKIPTWAMGALLGFTTSFFVETFNVMVNGVDKHHSLKQFPSFVSHIAGGAASFIVLPYIIGQHLNSSTAKTLGAAGVATELISQYIHETFVVATMPVPRTAGHAVNRGR